MTILKDLRAASFKAAPFIALSVTTKSGRKTVIHEYPNTDKRFVEDLGGLKESFSVEGIVHGANYFANRDALITTLKSAGPGELILPFYGAITVVAQPYSLVEETRTLGVAKFSMSFDRSDPSIFPRKSTNNVSLINEIKNNVGSSVNSDISNLFKVATNSSLNFDDARTTIFGMADSFKINSTSIFQVKDEISEFNAKLKTFTTNANFNIFNPSDLAKEFTGIFQTYEVLGTTPKNQFAIEQKLFDFGKGQEEIQRTTLQRIQRDDNRTTLNSAMQINSLAQAYNVVPQLTFDTENDIKITENILDDQFESVLSTTNSSDDTIRNLKNLRVEVRKFLDQELVNTFRISEIETKSIPATILTYQYYGSVDNTQKILDLNNAKNPSFLEKNLNILTT